MMQSRMYLSLISPESATRQETLSSASTDKFVNSSRLNTGSSTFNFEGRNLHLLDGKWYVTHARLAPRFYA